MPLTSHDPESSYEAMSQTMRISNVTQPMRRSVARSNPRNNHDDEKHKHASQEEAEAEISRMRRNGYHGSDRLNAYYNDELQGWFVGRSKYGY
jgi:hypothetical protein